MSRWGFAVAFAVCLATTSCSELQVKRDLSHAELSARYSAATASGARFDPSAVCRSAPAFKSWSDFEFAPASAVYALPNEVNAAAYCLAVPDGAKALELHGSSKGGMTYYEATAIYPSLLLLDGKYQLLEDLQRPRLTAGEGFFSGLGVSGIVPLVGDAAAARYIVVYIHPLSTSGVISVHTGYKTIPVPYDPYGTVRARFFP